MGSGIVRSIGEALFIQLGMTKDKWPHVTVERIQGHLDDPSSLDDQEGWEDWIECFYKYHDMYWLNQITPW